MDRSELLKKELISEEAIQQKVAELAHEISQDYRDRQPIFVGILRGAFVFLSDLVRKLEIPADIDFMAVSSYGNATKTSGIVRIVKDLDEDIEGRDVIIVEDIVDTGLTLSYLIDTLSARNPASIAVCALLLKKGKQQVEVPIEYIGFEIPDEFVVGYGLDCAGMFRHLPSIYVIDEDKLQG